MIHRGRSIIWHGSKNYTMDQTVPKNVFTLAEYLAIEPKGNVRYKFIDGDLVAMTGMLRAYNAIVTI